MKSRLKNKIVIVIALILTIFYFTNDFALIDIEKTAIIVALGIDKVDSGIELTAQIGVPQASQQTFNNEDTLISARGETVMEAVENISKRSGWFPKLSFCNVIILGKDLANDNVQIVCDHLLASEHFQSSALLAVCDGTARDFLSTPTPLDNISSFAIRKVIVENGAATSRVSDSNVKSFCQDMHGKKNCGYMPFITIISGEAKEEGQTAKAVNSGENFADFSEKSGDNGLIAPLFENCDTFSRDRFLSSTEGQSGGESSPSAIFDATKTAVFKDGKIVDILSEDETVYLNLLNKKAQRLVLTTKIDDKSCALEVYKNKHNLSLDFGVKPTLNLDLKLTVRVADSTTESANNNFLGRRSKVPDEYLLSLENDATTVIKSLATRMLEKGVDLFGIKDRLYKYHYFKYEDYKNIPLDQYLINLNVQVLTLDSPK